MTRVVEYELDEVNQTVTLVWEFQNPYGSHSNSMGNAQRLPNGNTLIGWGTYTEAASPACTEVTSDGEIVYELYFVADGMPLNTSSYRFYRFPLGIVMVVIISLIMIEKLKQDIRLNSSLIS